MWKRIPVLAILFLGCSPERPSLNITADPVTVPIGDCSFTTLHVTGVLNGTQLLDGSQPVTLTTDYGSFEQTGDCTDSSQDLREKTDVAVVGHTVTVRLFGDAVPPSGGSAHIIATGADAYGHQATAAIAVSFHPASDVTKLTFSCATKNIGAFATQSTSMEIPCTASATDATDAPVVGAQINFLTEAGSMTNDSGQLVYQPHAPGAAHPAPQDVDPDVDSSEPYWTDNTGKVHNPRDGQVTLVAWVAAPKEIVDQQGLSEPYVDWNDNGTYDLGEPFKDFNGNGQWDELQGNDPTQPPNQYVLWKSFQVLWTGKLQSEAPVATVSPLDSDPPYMGSTTYAFNLLDENYNPIASNDPSDSITWVVSPQPDITVLSANPEPLAESVGVTIENSIICSPMETSELFTLVGQVTHTLALTPHGDPADRVTESTMTLSGTLWCP